MTYPQLEMLPDLKRLKQLYLDPCRDHILQIIDFPVLK